jgi:hypothetical protein
MPAGRADLHEHADDRSFARPWAGHEVRRFRPAIAEYGTACALYYTIGMRCAVAEFLTYLAVMARQTSEKTLCAEGEKYIAKMTEQVAPAFGVDRGRLHRILERCAHHACMDATKDSNTEPHTAAAVRNGGVWISPRPWVALQIMTPGEFISLFEHEELSRLGWLERFVQFWLLRWDLRGSSPSVSQSVSSIS